MLNRPISPLFGRCARRSLTRVAQLSITALLAAPIVAPQTPASGAPDKVSADTPRATPGGATFVVPAGWSITSGTSSVVLQPPEPDSHVAIMDVRTGDASAAVAAAWAAYRPDSKRPLKLSTPTPARNGWEERRTFDYETSPNERAAVQAVALRAGKAWTVVILDGTDPTFDKRGSQVALIVQSLRPKGYQRESFAGRKALALNDERIAQLKTFVETSMQKLGIPGASLAFIDHGQVVFEGGLGVRELGHSTPVDANTLFMAASNTKGMSTLLLARLVDEKKLQWEQPVTQVYPSFKLGDADTTRQVLVKHLVCACTGLPRQDLEWIFEFKQATPASSLALLGTMQPTSRFGELFQYSNLMASAAGYIGGHLYAPSLELGAAYDQAMQKMIFDPLGMRSTTFDMSKAQKGNHALPHADDVDGKPTVARMDFNYSIAPHRPAGGVWTSAHDLIRYVQLEIGRGKLPNGKQLVSEENILARRKPQVQSGEDQSYGMGLSIDRTWGIPVVHHGGSMAGFKSDLLFLPDHGIGAVLLTNSDTGGMLLRPFLRRLLEVVFDGKPEAVEDIDGRASRYRALIAKDRERLIVPAGGEQVSKLAARYTSSALGGLAVRKQGPATIFDFGEWSSTVASRKNDDGTISFITIDPTINGLEFVVGERDGRRALVIRDGQHEYVFKEA
jgi:CubicO group peptidase (beta-lactamase class C family)